MIHKKDKEISTKATSITENGIDDLKQFVQKKKDQNVALKILIAKLNAK